MDYQHILEQEHSLDPANWEEMERLGIQMVKDMIGHLRTIETTPAWKQMDEAGKAGFNQALPANASPEQAVYNRFKKEVLPFPTGNLHPRFWAWADGNGTAFSMLTEMLAAGMNPNVCAGEHSAMYVEQQVINWLKEMMNFPREGSGILLSGGAMSNLTALIVARNAFGSRTIRKLGLRSLDGNLVLYASTETHNCIEKAAEIMGLGSQAVRKIPVNCKYEIDTTELRKAIAKDKSAGLLPFCIVANVGSVNTGSIDDLESLHGICREEGLWMHVDGAFGALAKLVGEYKERLKFIEHADSVTFDLHKWMYLPFGIGCLLVKDKNLHKQAFSVNADYLFKHERGLAAGPEMIADYGIEMSRGFKSLQVWMSIQYHGMEKYVQLIRQNIALAKYLERLIEQFTDLELVAPVPLNIVCFRFCPVGIQDLDLNTLNKEILMRLQESGVAVPSYTILEGRYCIRVAVINHRSKKKDMVMLLEEILDIGRALVTLQLKL
jgi:aromatic-L-amino-acid decarboxylase